MMRGRHSESMTKEQEGGATTGQDGGATRGGATTRRRNEMIRGWYNERMMKGWEGGVIRGWDGGTTRGDATPAGVMRQLKGGATWGWWTRGDATVSRHDEKKRVQQEDVAMIGVSTTSTGRHFEGKGEEMQWNDDVRHLGCDIWEGSKSKVWFLTSPVLNGERENSHPN